MDHEPPVHWIRRILFWPPNSPDLNEIEPCWNYLKVSIAQYNFIGSSEETRQRVQEALYAKWECMPQELIDHFCMNFYVNLLQVRACRGDNRFNSWWLSQVLRWYRACSFTLVVGSSFTRWFSWRKAASTPFPIWVQRVYSKRGAYSWRGDTSRFLPRVASCYGCLGNSGLNFDRFPRNSCFTGGPDFRHFAP